jgi:tetratricopeptide (TPR) repeat protein
MLYEKNGDNDSAMKNMEEIIKVDPDNAGALNFIGYSLAEKGVNLERAEALVRKALEKRPDDGYIRDSLGWVFYSKGEYPKALTEILRAWESIPDDPVIAEHLSDVYAKLGQRDKAIDLLRQSIELDKKGERKKVLEEKLRSLEQKSK